MDIKHEAKHAVLITQNFSNVSPENLTEKTVTSIL